MIDPTHQQRILARLSDFCRYGNTPHTPDFWTYLLEKVDAAYSHLLALKQEQFNAHRDLFFAAIEQGEIDEAKLTDFKQFLDSHLSPGDYADVAIHLTREELSLSDRRQWLNNFMRPMKVLSLMDGPGNAGSGSLRAKKLIEEMSHRIELDLCETVLARKPRTARRRRMVLRRIRRNVAEYCAVLHFPVSSDDTFSPFLLLRVEAVLVACCHILRRYR